LSEDEAQVRVADVAVTAEAVGVPGAVGDWQPSSESEDRRF
jgi:hypothetical protein